MKLWDARSFALERTFKTPEVRDPRCALGGRAHARGRHGRRVADLESLGAAANGGSSPTAEVPAVAISPDSGTVAYGGEAGKLNLLDASGHGKPRTLARFPGADVLSAAFSPDGARLAAGLSDGTARQ